MREDESSLDQWSTWRGYMIEEESGLNRRSTLRCYTEKELQAYKKVTRKVAETVGQLGEVTTLTSVLGTLPEKVMLHGRGGMCLRQVVHLVRLYGRGMYNTLELYLTLQ